MSAIGEHLREATFSLVVERIEIIAPHLDDLAHIHALTGVGIGHCITRHPDQLLIVNPDDERNFGVAHTAGIFEPLLGKDGESFRRKMPAWRTETRSFFAKHVFKRFVGPRDSIGLFLRRHVT